MPNTRSLQHSPAPPPSPHPPPHPHTYPNTPQQSTVAAAAPPTSTSGVIETHHAVRGTHDRSGRKMVNQYIVMEQLGKGMHGTVRRGIDSVTGELVAIKIVERVPKHKRLGMHAPRRPHARAGVAGALSNQAMRTTEDKIRREIAIMKKCHHPNVVELKEVIDDPHNKRIFLILECMEGGEVKWRNGLTDALPLLTVEQIRSIFRQVILGLEYLHYQGIIHRDIKPANLLLGKDGAVKISDFGVSHFSYALRLSAAASSASTNSPNRTRTIRTMSPSPRRPPTREEQAAAAAAEGGGPPILSPMRGSVIDDVLMDESDLAKTAGSPAFFAPELCHQGDLTGLAASFSVQTPTAGSMEFPGSPFAGNNVPYFGAPASATAPGSRDSERGTVASSSSIASSGAMSSPSLALSPANIPLPLSTSPPQPQRTLSSSSKHTFKATAAGEGPSTVRPTARLTSSRQSSASAAGILSTPIIPSLSSSLSASNTALTSNQPPPVTAAIDVWALGVTLYCLLFGKPPFEAPTEFMLYKKIPTEDFHVPEWMGKDRRRTGGRWGAKEARKRRRRMTMRASGSGSGGGSEGRRLKGHQSLTDDERDRGGAEEDDEEEGYEVVELLEKLLEKDPTKRISLYDLKRMPWVLRGIPDPTQWLLDNDPRSEEMVVIQDSDVHDAALFKRARFKRVIDKLKEKTKGALGGILGGLGMGLGVGRGRSKSTGSVNVLGGAGDEVKKEDAGSRPDAETEIEVTPTPPAVPNFEGPGPSGVSPSPPVGTPSGSKKNYRQSLPITAIQIGESRSAGPSSPSPSQTRSPLNLWSRFNHSPNTTTPTTATSRRNESRERNHPRHRTVPEPTNMKTPRSGSPVGNLLQLGENEGYFHRRYHVEQQQQTDGGGTSTDVPTRTPKARRASATALLSPPSGGMFRRTSSMSAGTAEPGSPTTTSGGKVFLGPLMSRPKPSMESVDTATSASASVVSGELRRMKTEGAVPTLAQASSKGKEKEKGQPPGTPKSGGSWLKRWGSSRRRKAGGVAGTATQPLTPLVPPSGDSVFARRPGARRSASALESGSEHGSIVGATASASALRYRPSAEVFTDDSSVGGRSNLSLSPIANYGGVIRPRGVQSVYHDTDDDLERVSSTGTRVSFSFSDDSDDDDGDEGLARNGSLEPNAMTMTGAGGFPAGVAIRNRGLGWEPMYPQQQQASHSAFGGYGHSPPGQNAEFLNGPSESAASSPGIQSPLALGGPHGSLRDHSSSSPSMSYSYSSPSSHSQTHMHSMHSQLQLQHPHPRQRSSNLSLELLSHGAGGSFHASSPSPLGYQSFPGSGGGVDVGARASLSGHNIEEEGDDDAEDEDEEEFLEVRRKPHHEGGVRARSTESARSTGRVY